MKNYLRDYFFITNSIEKYVQSPPINDYKGNVAKILFIYREF